jgi:glyoxylase-like metal-dependent hydrolase (beta-lactamase superfamily II)
MDRLEIPKEQVVPIEAVADGVQGLRIVFVNVFGLTHQDNSWTLVDSGLPYSASFIRNWAEKNFRIAPNAIVLSHGHFDHASGAAELSEHWNVPVYAHPLEEPYLSGKREYPAPNFAAGGGMMSLLSPALPRGPMNLGGRLRLIPRQASGNTALPEMPGWRVIHTPGHTPGHISFFRDSDRTLLAADAFCTTKPESFFQASIAQKPELHGPPSYFTSDWASARESVRLLAELQPLVVAPGHGQPIAGADVPSLLQQLAQRFDEIAVPANKKEFAA